jgi:hypothetical protein
MRGKLSPEEWATLGHVTNEQEKETEGVSTVSNRVKLLCFGADIDYVKKRISKRLRQFKVSTYPIIKRIMNILNNSCNRIKLSSAVFK